MPTRPIERAPYGRQGETVPALSDPRPLHAIYQGENYYGHPAIKPSHYGQLVAAYLFVGGLAGASQLMATIAERCGRSNGRFTTRAGRYAALAGGLASPVFLIADLKTPRRWYNMLRIFRPTSTMSIGSWTLATFGAITALTAGAQALSDLTGAPFFRHAARWLGVPAATSGALVATYTGTLLGATSTPLWASANRFLPALFGVSAAATSTAALSLAAHLKRAPAGTMAPLERLSLVAGGAELLLTSALERRLEREAIATPLQQEPLASAYGIGYKALGIVAPLMIHGAGVLLRWRSRPWSMAAAVATLAGGYIFRSALLAAGKRSAERPEDYFVFTQRGSSGPVQRNRSSRSI